MIARSLRLLDEHRTSRLIALRGVWKSCLKQQPPFSLLTLFLFSLAKRTSGLLVVKLSLGISGFPAGSNGSSLGEALGGVLPAVQYLPLSTKGLNKCLFAPKKDYETEQVRFVPPPKEGRVLFEPPPKLGESDVNCFP